MAQVQQSETNKRTCNGQKGAKMVVWQNARSVHGKMPDKKRKHLSGPSQVVLTPQVSAAAASVAQRLRIDHQGASTRHKSSKMPQGHSRAKKPLVAVVHPTSFFFF